MGSFLLFPPHPIPIHNPHSNFRRSGEERLSTHLTEVVIPVYHCSVAYVQFVLAKFDRSVLLTPAINKKHHFWIRKMWSLQPSPAFQLLLLSAVSYLAPPSIFSIREFELHNMSIVTLTLYMQNIAILQKLHSRDFVYVGLLSFRDLSSFFNDSFRLEFYRFALKTAINTKMFV